MEYNLQNPAYIQSAQCIHDYGQLIYKMILFNIDNELSAYTHFSADEIEHWMHMNAKVITIERLIESHLKDHS